MYELLWQRTYILHMGMPHTLWSASASFHVNIWQVDQLVKNVLLRNLEMWLLWPLTYFDVPLHSNNNNNNNIFIYIYIFFSGLPMYKESPNRKTVSLSFLMVCYTAIFNSEERYMCAKHREVCICEMALFIKISLNFKSRDLKLVCPWSTEENKNVGSRWKPDQTLWGVGWSALYTVKLVGCL